MRLALDVDRSHPECAATHRRMVATARSRMSLCLQGQHRTETDRPHLRRRLCGGGVAAARYRSEEHTSELQSRLHLVCRLLLEKKKKNIEAYAHSAHTKQ